MQEGVKNESEGVGEGRNVREKKKAERRNYKQHEKNQKVGKKMKVIGKEKWRDEKRIGWDGKGMPEMRKMKVKWKKERKERRRKQKRGN